MKQNENVETTTPPEEVNGNDEKNYDEVDRYLEHMCAYKTPYVMLDRTGLRISFFGLLPITTGEDGNQRIWGGSILLNSGELEYPQIDFKLRVTTKRNFDPQLSCNRSKGVIKQKDTFLLSYQLPESSIKYIKLTLITDGTPHEVPLCKYPKADYFWIGKDTKGSEIIISFYFFLCSVPGPAQLLQERKHSTGTEATTMKNVSPGRIENIPDGLKDFIFGGNGLQMLSKMLYPHGIALFRDLSEVKLDNFDVNGMLMDGNSTDGLFHSTLHEDLQNRFYHLSAIAEEIVRRFHDANREKFPTELASLH
ncbi:Protein CBG02626 [Caenorhabditis briggsae]|uniref:Protein CBG02626 n=1 Tax=Caenorhabditis briggsae TaxID=6238 RepID=A8WTW2_CAEBR|nr:Protein CBG02626 [Caenorhabditis briggsae]CAP23924.2 Protein CBG02626 [Caenorhabditis briggsae]